MSTETEIWNGYEDALASELTAGELTNMFVGAIPAGWAGPVYLCIEPDKPTQREWIRAATVNVGLARFESLTRDLEGSVGDITHPANSIVRAVVTRQLVGDIFSDLDAVELDLAQHETDGGDPHASAGYLKQADTDALYVELNGDTMTGALVLNANPVVNLGAATKQYVDGAIIDPTGVYLPLDGSDPMQGALDMGGTNKIVNLANGTTDQDAATTKQVADAQTSVEDDLTTHKNDAGDPHAAAGYLKSADVAGVYLPLDGSDPMVGSIDMGANPINNIADGTLADDAVSKLQMDTAISDAIAAALTAYDTAAASDAKMASYYTKNDDPRAVAGRRIYIQAGDPGAIANDDIWHDLP